MFSDNLKEIIGRNLRNIRAERKMTREQMAELVGVSTTFYANLETGNKMMSVTTLKKIADALGVSTDSILYEDRPCKAADRIQKALSNQPQEIAHIAEKLVQVCVTEVPQVMERKRDENTAQ